jgi:N-succinyldiaminopimelate aminotransferase
VKDMVHASTYQLMSELAQRTGAVNLAQGIPEALNDARINEALAASIDAGWQYTPVEGDAALRSAIAAEYDGGFTMPGGLVVTSGCTEALLIALVAAGDRFGNRVSFFEPFYSYYPGLVRLAGLTFDIVPLHFNGAAFQPDLKALECAIRSGARIVLLNTPHNPTGWVCDLDTARALALWAEENDALVVIDEVYRDFVYAEKRMPVLWQLPGLRGRCMVANAVTKSFAASGMRIGWLLGPPAVLRDALVAHMHLSNCLPRPLQRAAAHLFAANDVRWRQSVRDHYRIKRDRLLQALIQHGFRCALPDGGHFILADYRPVSDQPNSLQFALWFAENAGVVPMPIDDFYDRNAPQMVRFSFAVPMSAIEEALCRLGRVQQ